MFARHSTVDPDGTHEESYGNLHANPAWRLPDRKTPIGWFTGTNDKFYFLSGVMKSFEMAGGPRHLTLLPNWDHALPTILTDELFLAWLDTHLCGKGQLRGKGALPSVTALTLANDAGRLVARWDFSGEAASADLIVSYGEPGNWVGRFWHTFPAEITGNACRAEFPPGKIPCLISGAVITQNGLRTSTPILTVDANPLGLTPEISVPDYDGCREWGGFEEAHIAYLDRHTRSGQTRWHPKLSRDARHGTHAAILEPGRTVLPPILSTATIPHRFTCWLKGDKPTDVTVQLGSEIRKFTVGATWTEIELRHTPSTDLKGGIAATITIPADTTVLVDSFEFHPIGR